MRVELQIVQEQSASVRGSCAMDGDLDGLDVDESARQAAEHLAAVAPRAGKAVYSWHKIEQDPSGMRDPGRIERAHPLEFTMGIGGLFDDVRDEESTRLRSVPARVWSQHMLRLWGGTCVHGLRGHRLVWAVTNLVLLQEARGKGYIVQKNALGRLGIRMDPNTHMTKDGLRARTYERRLCSGLSKGRSLIVRSSACRGGRLGFARRWMKQRSYRRRWRVRRGVTWTRTRHWMIICAMSGFQQRGGR